jgi:hypothetical protein
VGRPVDANMDSVAGRERPTRKREDLTLTVSVSRRLRAAASLTGRTPSELADDILGRTLPEIPADYLAATASLAG